MTEAFPDSVASVQHRFQALFVQDVRVMKPKRSVRVTQNVDIDFTGKVIYMTIDHGETLLQLDYEADDADIKLAVLATPSTADKGWVGVVQRVNTLACCWCVVFVGSMLLKPLGCSGYGGAAGLGWPSAEAAETSWNFGWGMISACLFEDVCVFQT